MRFLGKVALVTGAGSGLGRATALRFAEEGAHLALVDIDQASLEKVGGEIEDLGRSCAKILADVSEVEDCERMVRETMEQFGQLDVVFANAGIGSKAGGAPIADMDPEDWDRVVAVNLRGVFLTCKYSVPALIESGQGAIVTNGSSMAGWDTSLNGAAYMASKAGVTGLTKSLALQLGGYGIRVNAVCAGVFKTRLGYPPGMSEEDYEARYERFANRIPLRRVGEPEDLAATVAFLASDEARHITGSLILIDGGQTLQSWSNAPESETYPSYLEAFSG